MRRFLATPSNLAAGFSAIVLAVCSHPSSRAAEESAAEAAPSAATCGTNDVIVYRPDPSFGIEPPCAAAPRSEAEIAEGRAYVAETASPGYTMTRQGTDLAIGRLHPEFVVRLAKAIREARNAGLPFAGVFSAYRPPAFGVGGFSNKFHSLHTYGLAVDMKGIGRPGSPEAHGWHEIAARNGVVCPYGPRNRVEWNHCQPTSMKIILPDNPLRETVAADGPLDLDDMFEAGNALIQTVESAVDSVARIDSTPVRAVEAVANAVVGKAQREERSAQRDDRKAQRKQRTAHHEERTARRAERTAQREEQRERKGHRNLRAASRVAAKLAGKHRTKPGTRTAHKGTRIIAVEESPRASRARRS